MNIRKLKNLGILVLAWALQAGTANALSGHLDLSKFNTGSISVVASTGEVATINSNGDWYLSSTGVNKVGMKKHNPQLSWVSIGSVARLYNADPSAFVVDAYGIDGRLVASNINFIGEYVTIPGNNREVIYLKLKQVKTEKPVTLSRSFTDSNHVGVIYFIVIDPSGRIDTLREIPVTNWSQLLGTSYVVSRNVDVTIPAKYDRDTVKVGWFNTRLNPSNYFTVVLGRSYKSQYSGIIFTAYDSASYGADAYLYSAVAIIKHGDSVVAFTKDLDTVTAKVGNFRFDSTRFVNKIVSRPLADSAIVPWYAFAINKSTVNVVNNRVMKLDSTVTHTDSLVDSAWNTMHALMRFSFGAIMYFGNGSSTPNITVSGLSVLGDDSNIGGAANEYDDHTLVSELDSIRIAFVSDTSDASGYVSVDTLSTRDKFGVNVQAVILKLPVDSGEHYEFTVPVSKKTSTYKYVNGIDHWNVFIHYPSTARTNNTRSSALVYKIVKKYYK